MTTDNSETINVIEQLYKDIESQFVIEDGPEKLSEAVTFSNNRPLPIHRWFTFKEAFSANIFNFLSIDESRMQNRDSIFMDPFCGCGTTILSCDLQKGWACERIGIETNPFIAFVANTKVNWRKYNPQIIKTYAENLLTTPLITEIPEKEWPNLSTLKDPEMFDNYRVSSLIDAIRRSRELPEPYSDIFMLGIASIVEKVSLYRKTGRALRKLKDGKSYDARVNISVDLELRNTLSSFASDLEGLTQFRKNISTLPRILQGDGRIINNSEINTLEPKSVSLMVYSPPYLNQIDYTEVYKVESWLLGFISSAEAMKKQRLATVRSHSSIKFPESTPELTANSRETLNLIKHIVTGNGDAWHEMFARTADGYFSDMQKSLIRQYELLEPGAQVRCIIGNSAYGSKGSRIAVATDLFLADIAHAIGFDVLKIQIARMLSRKDHLNNYLRESVIWLQKPEITT